MTPLEWVGVVVLVVVAGAIMAVVGRRRTRHRSAPRVPESNAERAARAEALGQISRDIERGRSAARDSTSQQGTFL